MAYIDDDDDDDPSLPLYHTMPYVCGKVLLASVLDSLVAAVSVYLFSFMTVVLPDRPGSLSPGTKQLMLMLIRTDFLR